MNTNHQTKLLFILFFFLFHSLSAAVTVQVNPPTVQLGQAFHLIFTLDKPQGSNLPDLTPLQKDFTIVGTERSNTYSIINGQTQSIARWIILLTPKKAGLLTIPTIQIGHQQTMPASINVTETTTLPTPDEQEEAQQAEVMIKTEVSTQEPFVNQQVIYTVKLYTSQRLMDAEYRPPQVKDALLVPLGEGQRHEEVLNGQHFAVEEQNYVVFPQKSGELKIISPTFNALVFDTVPRRISIHAKPVKLNVKPAPLGYSGNYWLPAKQVALTEVYEEPHTKIKEGDTLVRTVTLQAAGVPAQLLPHLKFEHHAQFNSYSEKPELRNIAHQKELIGRADIKVTYIFNKGGKITIPALNLTWFNTDTSHEETASLPARTVDVEPTTPLTHQAAKPAITTPSNSIILEPGPVILPQTSNHLAWWVAGGFAVAWIITLLLWQWSKTKKNPQPNKRKILHAVQIACEKNEPQEAEIAMLHWAKLHWRNIEFLNLEQVGAHTHDPLLKKQLDLLSKKLYGPPEKTTWQGMALWESLVGYLQKKEKPLQKEKSLPPINPEIK